MQNPANILKKYWGHTGFRPLQEDIIQSILSGKDTLALLPTGGGKSICFQVPAMMMDGICLVVSPLIALMRDQVHNLERRGIPALCIFTGMPYREIVDTMRKAASGQYKFLYCSPERLESSLFREYLPALPLSLLAVDEAHCISQWGYDFRPSYLNIASVRQLKKDLPILALTASATPEVRQDIIRQLDLREPATFAGSFARPNLSYHVMRADSRIHLLTRLVKKAAGSGIVYCKSRKRTHEIAQLLMQENISADFYHAGLRSEDRYEKQQRWLRGETRFIVCTNAFGMGIDKPDVRTVIHVDCPDSLENYYQEAGRAGRDGEPAFAILITDQQTAPELAKLPDARFPPMEVIRKVYQSLGDYLQIAAGTGEDKFFDFDLAAFTKRFSLDNFQSVYTLQALEQENIIQMTEQMYRPSLVEFTTNRETIEMVEQQHPDLEPLVKALLRTYTGIWDQPSGISEKQLCKILRKPLEEVTSGLQHLMRLGILRYEPRKENPQVRYKQNRIKTDDLYIDQQRYRARKMAYTARVEGMIRYISDKARCRTQLICAYFGENDCNPCGHCDHCKRSVNVSNEEIIREINAFLSAGPHSMLALKEKLEPYGSKAMEILDFMISEGKLRADSEGNIGR